MPNLVYNSLRLDVIYIVLFYNYKFRERDNVGACCNIVLGVGCNIVLGVGCNIVLGVGCNIVLGVGLNTDCSVHFGDESSKL